jgi:hypothetical protein
MRERRAGLAAGPLGGALATALLLGALAAATSESRAGGAGLDLPEGWKPAPHRDSTVLYPPGLDPGQVCFLLIGASQELEGIELRAWFDREWASVSEGRRLVRGGGISAGWSQGGAQLVSTSAVFQDERGVQALAWFAAARHGSRVTGFLFWADRPELYERHARVVQAWIDRSRFDVTPPTPPQPERSETP